MTVDVLRFSTVSARILGDGGTAFLARVVCPLLAAIAIQLVADSAHGFIEVA